MGISSDGQLNYGICFEEEFEFPWGEDVKEWWKKINGFKNPHPSPFDETGNWKDGKEDDAVYEVWLSFEREWENNNPIPIEMKMHCSYDYPMYIMICPETGYYNSRGFPTEIPLHELNNFHTEKAQAIIKEFCKKYEIETDFKFGWWLTSLYG